jgi:hypothetical protein
MFVYKRDTLEKTIEYISDNRARVGIYHAPTKMALSFVVYTNERMPKLEPNVYPSKSFSDAPLSSLVSDYEIRGMQKDSDKYSFVKDVYSPRKTLVENFLEAIEVFENEIFERLNEQKPQATPPETPPQPEAEKKSELPRVGDFVRQGKVFGRVVDVNQETREVKISIMSEADVMAALKLQQMGMKEEASESGFIMAAGGDTGFFVVIVDEQGSNLKILRPTPPPQGGGDMPEPPEGTPDDQKQEPQPDNIEDPFDDSQSDDSKGQDGEGQDGEGQDGEGQDGEGEDGEGQDADGQNENGQDGDSQDGDDEFSEDDADFGDESEGDEQSFQDKIEEERKEQLSMKERLERMAEGDLETITRALGLTDLKKDLPSRRAAEKLTDGLTFFDTMNEARIINAINFAFK